MPALLPLVERLVLGLQFGGAGAQAGVQAFLHRHEPLDLGFGERVVGRRRERPGVGDLGVEFRHVPRVGSSTPRTSARGRYTK